VLVHQLAKRRVVHVPGEKFRIVLHPVDEQSFKCFLEHESEILLRVRVRRLHKLLIGDGFLSYLVEEQLVCWLEIRSKLLVDDVNEPGKLDGRVFVLSSADGGWSGDNSRLACRQRDGTFADFLQTIKLERHVVVKIVLRAGVPSRKLRDEEPNECEELLKVAIAEGDDLREK